MKFSAIGIFTATFLLLYSCTDQDIEVVQSLSCDSINDISIVETHDASCDQLCAIISDWRAAPYQTQDLYYKVFDEIMVQDLAQRLSISNDSLNYMYSQIGITRDNYTNYSNVAWEGLPTDYKRFINDLEDFYVTCTSTQEILSGLEELKIKWSQSLDPEIVCLGIEIAKSSFPYWFENVDSCIYPDQIHLRIDRCKAAIALADVTGGIFGAISAGILSGGTAALPGAMLGAEGGTLGAAIVAAALGGC